jgi:hypothetical protein
LDFVSFSLIRTEKVEGTEVVDEQDAISSSRLKLGLGLRKWLYTIINVWMEAFCSR